MTIRDRLAKIKKQFECEERISNILNSDQGGVQVAIFRHPVFMEDGGHSTYILTCSEKTAQEWIAAQEGEYYNPSNYFIRR